MGGVRLEDVKPGLAVRGVVPGQAVMVVQVAWFGAAAINLTYRDRDGRVHERLLYRADEGVVSLPDRDGGFTFDADGRLFRLASEARRIGLAHLFDPMVAVTTSTLEPLPHQIQAVYGELLPRKPLRLLLADDPGAGKTIMAGLYVKELMLRGDVRRCLVVAPGSLNEQWQDELSDKFGLRFELLTRDMVNASASGNPFVERPLLIARMHQVSRSDELLGKLRASDWDLVVIDEAHKMSAHYYGSEVEETRLYRLGKALSGVARHLLVMTATPHAGKDEEFQLFLALLDADRFEGKPRGGRVSGVRDLMVRRTKEELLTFEGRRLFPERRASSVPYPLSAAEQALYEAVTAYVIEGMNRADRLADAGQRRRGNAVGFALTILQRRLASSPEAIYQSLRRRHVRLEGQLAELAAGPAGGGWEPRLDVPADEEALEDLSAAEREQVEDEVAGAVSAARTVAELEAEVADVARLEAMAQVLRASGEDRKWRELADLLDDREHMFAPDGTRRKLIVFTEHRDTLSYLVERLRVLLGRPEAVIDIHGGTSREERRRRQQVFTQDQGCAVLVATDAAGEGINLQCAHLLVNYDLPWNPNRIEQRFGRVHRIGQTEVCHMWNLVAEQTREGQVYLRLLRKVEEQCRAYGGKVFDVLGRAFDERPLRELLVEAVRYGNRPDVRSRLDEVVDQAAGERLGELVSERALVTELLTAADVERLRVLFEQAQARRLQPFYVQSFFLEAFGLLGGRCHEREPQRFEVRHVPYPLRERAARRSATATVLPSYTRICFDKARLRVPGKPPAELVAPGHPLLDVVLDVVQERWGALLRQGAMLVDEQDRGEAVRVLAYLEHQVADGRYDRDGRPLVVSHRFEFVTLAADGAVTAAGPAPYLDCRPATPDEVGLLRPVLEEPWLRNGVEERAQAWAVTQAAPGHLEEVRASTLPRLAKVRQAVSERLTGQIEYWHQRANELFDEADLGRQPRMNPERARRRAEDLEARLAARMAELDRAEQLHALPPVLVGAALLVPAGLLARLRGTLAEPPAGPYAKDTAEVDRRAVAAVLAAERRLGREPNEMPHSNPGYDILSVGAGGEVLFLEVKGRIAGQDRVHVSRNQVLHGLNKPDQYVLALVRVHPNGADGDQVRYLRRPFEGLTLGTRFEATGVEYNFAALWATAEPPA